jgi:hypothetical protein
MKETISRLRTYPKQAETTMAAVLEERKVVITRTTPDARKTDSSLQSQTHCHI